MYLELDRLSKQFDGKYAVHDLSLGLEEGGLLCILGSSGCGKTTTLNMIGGFLKPDGGRVLLDGQDITALPPERRPVSTVFQSYGLFPHMSVEKNIAYGLRMRGVDRETQRASGRIILCHLPYGCKDQGMVGDHELSALFSCFLHDVLGRVERAQHTVDFLSTITCHQAAVVPALRQIIGGKAL